MSDILIIYRMPCREPDIYINGEFQRHITEFSISSEAGQDLPIFKVKRWKLDRHGKPYTIGGGFVAPLTEYYPVHKIESRWGPLMYF